MYDTVMLGVVEGLTEFLPVSSTKRLIFTSNFFGLPDSEFLKRFEITIQLGAISAIAVLYWRSFVDIAVMRLFLQFVRTRTFVFFGTYWILAVMPFEFFFF